MDKTIFLAWERSFPGKKAPFEAWELQVVETGAWNSAASHFNPARVLKIYH